MYLLVHTMTITECDYVLQAQFFHALPQNVQQGQLIARRMRLRFYPQNGGNLVKAQLQRLQCANLKSLMKANKGNVRHHLRAIKIGSQNVFPNGGNLDEKAMVTLSPASSHNSEKQPQQPETETTVSNDNNLVPTSNPLQIANWLNNNRFEKYATTFANFSGADMLRMSREDFIQICGHADGIRLYNALHSKTVAPKLTLYICKENSSVFNAIYLARLNNAEVIQKLATLFNVSVDNIKDVYVQGPQMIHVQLNAELIQHIKDETMFHAEVIHQNNNNQQNDCGKFVILLKAINKN